MSVLLISLLFGGCAMVLVWHVYRFFHSLPVQDMQFRDRPAIGFRLIWPLIQAFDHYGSRWMSESQLNRISRRLSRAGAEYSLTAQQFLGAKCATGFILVAVVLLLGRSLSIPLLATCLIAFVAGYYYPDLWLKEQADRRTAAIVRALPFYLDVVTLAVESGSSLTGALTQAVHRTPDCALRKELSRALRDIRSGRARADALRDIAQRTGCVQLGHVVRGMVQAEKTGASLGGMLRAQAAQLRSDRFNYAEKKAMEAPVKMLGPLVLFFFPTTGLVITYILISKAIIEGLLSWPPLVWMYHWPG